MDDAAELARLCAQLGYPQAAAEFEARLRRVLASPDHPVLVATHDDRALLGFVALERRLLLESGEVVEIAALAVDAQARRRGIARALLAAAEDWARRIGIAELVVRSNVARAESHPFYQGVGFRRAKTQHVYRKPA
ncbi:GNAT family N-acetyltransferase [Vulcaniibacterium tengchongense]|nr:GNAT family N-acetyltransferase [Vulcaniibacterium tengchongense]